MIKFNPINPLSDKTPNENMLILAYYEDTSYDDILSKLQFLNYEIFKTYNIFNLVLIGKIDSSLPSDTDIDSLKQIKGVKNVERNIPSI